MQYLAVSAFVASSLLSGVAHAGVAAVHNMCDQPMYLWSVGDGASEKITLPDQTVMYNETYRGRNNGAGISIKISGEPELGNNATQFEYTVDPPSMPKPMIWYDLSNINGNALPNVDYELKPSDKDCPVVYCAAGASKCKAVYNVWNDDESTHACTADSDLVFTLCPNKKADGTPSDLPGSDGSPAVTDDGPSTPYVPATGGPIGESGPSKKVATSKIAKSSDAIKEFLHPTFAKRDASPSPHAHAHSHAHSHQRLRRSRVFRAEQ